MCSQESYIKGKKAIPQESLRARVKDDSQVDNTFTDSGTDMTSRSSFNIEAGGMIGTELCVCSKMTTVRGLTIHHKEMGAGGLH